MNLSRESPETVVVIDIEDHRSVWMVTRERCFECGHTCVGTVHKDAPLDALECGGCHRMTCQVTHVLMSDDSWNTRIADVIPLRGGT